MKLKQINMMLFLIWLFVTDMESNYGFVGIQLEASTDITSAFSNKANWEIWEPLRTP